jgi:membrane protease YdiL (CAAX protease family)
VGFLLIGVGVVAMGFVAQHAPSGVGEAEGGHLASHGKAIPIYLSLIAMDWALLYYCWIGVRRYGGGLANLSGGRWTSWTGVAVDMGIAVPFWLLWEGVAHGTHRLLSGATGGGSARTVDSLLPQNVPEVLLWVALSGTAGICEELVFRGFLQRQFHAMSGNIVLAVLAQGVVFGLFHSYQGWQNVVVISVLGVLYGALAAWRRNVRANIVLHAWTDVWEGWLKFVVWQ